MTHSRFRKVVVAHSGYNVEVSDEIHVELGETVGCYLALVAIVGELVGLEIVAHHISSQSQDMASGKGVVVRARAPCCTLLYFLTSFDVMVI